MANTAPMYPTSLLDVFNQGQWGLFGPMMDQQRTAQAQSNANLSAALQAQKQSEEMHPLRMQTEQAQLGQIGASTRLTNLQADEKEQAAKVLAGIPLDKQIAAKLSDLMKNKSANELAMLNDEMGAAAIYAARGIQNGGKLPLGDLARAQEQHPGLVPYLTSPDGLQKLGQVVAAHNSLQPELQKSKYDADMRYKTAVDVANINQRGETARTSMSLSAKGASGENKPPVKKTIENLIAEYGDNARAALAAGDMASAQKWIAERDKQVAIWLAGKSAAASEANRRAPDPNQFGITTVTPPSGVKIPQPGNIPSGWNYLGTK